MPFDFDERRSDSPLVETVWGTYSERAGEFTSVAVSRWEMVVTKLRGKTSLAVRGPETKPTSAAIPPDAEFFGIVFKHGAFLPRLPGSALVDDARDLSRTSRSFELGGATWQFPTFDNADTFVARLVKKGELVFDPVVADALVDERRGIRKLSQRTVRRHCLRATGLTANAIRRIDRARQATALLQQGVPILDTVHELGYFDQAHLTRTMKRFIGHSPAEILRMGGDADMSLSYKTAEFRDAIDQRHRGEKR
jgi:AraC-like DNA-binding protein